MKTISDYTIYCSPEQTKKALDLGAQINTIGCTRGEIPLLDDYVELVVMDDNTSIIGKIPTAEQMIGWLEWQKQIDEVVIYKYQRLGRRYWCYDIYDENGFCVSIDDNRREGYSSRKEATLAAIDAALEYLSKNNK